METQIRGPCRLKQILLPRVRIHFALCSAPPAGISVHSKYPQVRAPGSKESPKAIRKESDLEFQPCPQACSQ